MKEHLLILGDCGMEYAMKSGGRLRVEGLAEGIMRVRLSASDEFPENLMMRYGFVNPENRRAPLRIEHSPTHVRATCGSLTLEVDTAAGKLAWHDGGGRTLLEESRPSESTAALQFRTAFRKPPTLRIFGLGDQTRERIEHTGTTAQMWIENVKRYIPIPLLVTDGGFGLLVNTTVRHEFDLGAANPEEFGFSGLGDILDYIVLYGPGMPEILERYTALTGRPPLPPKWTFGLWFLNHMEGRGQDAECMATARDVLDSCLSFRREGIPCDGMLMEPNWMKVFYDMSVNKEWHPDRFHIPSWATASEATFLGAMRRLGFKPGLWLCNMYDLTYEEERRAKTAAAAVAAPDKAAPCEDDFEKDAHFARGERLDKVTKPEEPWFAHLRKFVDQGIEVFKQDGSSIINEFPDRLYGNRLTDLEIHNIYALMCAKQMHLGFKEHTRRRPAVLIPGGWTGLQRWCGTWTGDTGGGPKSVVACLNLSMCGHAYVTMDMDVFSPEAIHAGFLMPWSQLNSWAYWRHPWLLDEARKQTFIFYDRLHYRLLPYLYACAREAFETGMPIMRPMPLVFPDDPACSNLIRQFMLGRELLVSCFTDRVYLPEGTWTDYWTGRSHRGPVAIEYRPPEGRGGGLFVRAGAIIPLGIDRAFIGENQPFASSFRYGAHDPSVKHEPDAYLRTIPDREITLDIHPGAAGACTIYEDDGMTFAYEEGEFAKTRITTEASDDALRVRIGSREGRYHAMPESIAYTLAVRAQNAPREVRRSGRLVPLSDRPEDAGTGWHFANGVVTVRLGAVSDGGETVEFL